MGSGTRPVQTQLLNLAPPPSDPPGPHLKKTLPFLYNLLVPAIYRSLSVLLRSVDQ